jgi:hypothetical protein
MKKLKYSFKSCLQLKIKTTYFSLDKELNMTVNSTFFYFYYYFFMTLTGLKRAVCC